MRHKEAPPGIPSLLQRLSFPVRCLPGGDSATPLGTSRTLFRIGLVMPSKWLPNTHPDLTGGRRGLPLRSVSSGWRYFPTCGSLVPGCCYRAAGVGVGDPGDCTPGPSRRSFCLRAGSSGAGTKGRGRGSARPGEARGVGRRGAPPAPTRELQLPRRPRAARAAAGRRGPSRGGARGGGGAGARAAL